MHLFSRALEVAYSTSNVWEGLPYVCMAAGIFAGGIIALTAIMWIIEFFTLGQERRYYYVGGGTDKKGRPRLFYPNYGTWRNIWHLTLLSIFFSGVVFIIWIASSVIGMNPWTSAAATLSLGVVMTYSFAGVLGHISSAVSVFATNSAGVDQYWEFAGLGEGYEGRIHTMNKMGVVMIRYDVEKAIHEEIYMPMSYFTNNPRKRNFQKELAAMEQEQQVQQSWQQYQSELHRLRSEKEEREKQALQVWKMSLKKRGTLNL